MEEKKRNRIYAFKPRSTVLRKLLWRISVKALSLQKRLLILLLFIKYILIKLYKNYRDVIDKIRKKFLSLYKFLR